MYKNAQLPIGDDGYSSKEGSQRGIGGLKCVWPELNPIEHL